MKALVLSGGGSTGSFQVGVLNSIPLDFDRIYGTSVGALNGAALSFMSLDELNKIWNGIRGRGDVFRGEWWKLPFSTGYFSTAPLRKIVEKSILPNTAKIPVTVCYVDMSDGSVAYGRSDELTKPELINAIVSSCAIPGINQVVEDRYADGGVREQIPLSRAIKDGCTDITVIATSPYTDNPFSTGWKPTGFKLTSALTRMMGMMTHEGLMNDIQVCIGKNTLPGYKKIKLHIYAPECPLHDALDFSPKTLQAAIALGKAAKVIHAE